MFLETNKRMKALTLLLTILLLFSTPAVFAQQKRQPPKPATRRIAPPTKEVEAPTFDTLLGTDCYKIYVEARGVGQLIRSNSVNELVEPVMKLAAPPKEFKTLVKWLNTHADEVMTSRMLVAAWPTAKNVPEAVIAIEFESPAAAAKFEPQLNTFLPKVMPTPAPEPSPSPGIAGATAGSSEKTTVDKPDVGAPPKPSYYLKQVGSLILITPTQLVLKNLRPGGSRALSEDPNFRLARNRFTAEQLFLYVDMAGIEKEDQDRQKEFREEEKRREAEALKEAKETPQTSDTKTEDEKLVEEKNEIEATSTTVVADQSSQPPPEPDPIASLVSSLTSSFFSGQGKWPQGIGAGLSLENESLEVRALMVTAPGEKADVIPFFPNLITAGPIVPESPSILPADTELFATLALDLPQIYAAMSKKPDVIRYSGAIRYDSGTEWVGPFADLEKKLNIKIKEDVLPLLGSEIVVSMPVKMLADGPRRVPPPDANAADSQNAGQKSSEPSPVVALSVRDKEGVRALLPKIVEGLGFKGASALAQTERREDTEMVSYGNVLAYAFIGNFLVLSGDTAAIRHVVDSYLKHETLSADPQFKNYTRWQPRQLQAQIYLSPALMESYKTWANDPTTLISDATREFLSQISVASQSVTYSLSNDGLGTLHELHVPKSLVLMAIAGISEGSNPSPMVSNERATLGALYMIANAESQYRSGKGAGSYGSKEQLIAGGFLSEDSLENHGYKIEVTVTSGNKFTITATPVEYGKTGRTSYFLDESIVLRGGDHGGSTATMSDKPIQ